MRTGYPKILAEVLIVRIELRLSQKVNIERLYLR